VVREDTVDFRVIVLLRPVRTRPPALPRVKAGTSATEPLNVGLVALYPSHLYARDSRSPLWTVLSPGDGWQSLPHRAFASGAYAVIRLGPPWRLLSLHYFPW